MYRLFDPFSDLDRCPQCGCAKPTLHLHSAFVDVRAGITSGLGWLTYYCSSCHDLVAFQAKLRQHVRTSEYTAYLHQNIVLWERMVPEGIAPIAGLPERAGRYLQQAVDAIFAPDGAVMLAGSAVDAMLKEKGYDKGSVHARIEQAVKDNLLTSAMGEWAHAVRLQANQPRHADLDEPHATAEQAKQTIEFAKALGDFLFVLPERIAQGKRAAEQADTSSVENDR